MSSQKCNVYIVITVTCPPNKCNGYIVPITCPSKKLKRLHCFHYKYTIKKVLSVPFWAKKLNLATFNKYNSLIHIELCVGFINIYKLNMI
jgi:hypothetical protein